MAKTHKGGKGSASSAQGNTAANGASGKAVGVVAAVAIVIAVALGSTVFAPGETGAGNSSSASAPAAVASSSSGASQVDAPSYTFRSKSQLKEHYKKHGREMGYASAEDYLAGANAVIANPDALHKIQREDSDDVYYLESTDEFVVVSTDGYIRTYFNPGGIGYYNNQ